jgi:hypothetical protein
MKTVQMKTLLVLVNCGLLLSACVRNNPKPVWLKIGTWTLAHNPELATQPETLTHNFTDAWVSVDNKIIGIFELPCHIPVLASGEKVKIVLYPVVRNNGISASKKVYPFCKGYETTIALKEGETYELSPVTMYMESADFEYIEDFFGSQADFESSDDDYPEIGIENDPAISMTPGNSYAHIHLTAGNPEWAGHTSNMLLPQGKEVYLEIDYRNTIDATEGVIVVAQDGSFKEHDYIILQKQDASQLKWKKMYIDLREIVSSQPSTSEFVQYLKASLPDGTSETDIYIDNIHVVHF